MAIPAKLLFRALTALTALSGAFASPISLDDIEPIPDPLKTGADDYRDHIAQQNFEYTAFGDSYSSGVGAGEYIKDCYRCLRYDQAYPQQINKDGRLPGNGGHTFNNVVCSGSNTTDVELYQFNENDEWNKPDRQYGIRPKVGNPTMATLSIGGNDIDFPGIIFNCILQWNPPGTKYLPCPEQKERTRALLDSQATVDNIAHTINKVVDRGRLGPAKDRFKLYVTGFPRFFNEKTKPCDDVTFARDANPIRDPKKEYINMTQELRGEFNQMSDKLNQDIAAAVALTANRGVTWVPVDGVMEGHRFCEEGVTEPDQNNGNLWLFHYPYNEPEDPKVEEVIRKAAEKVTGGGEAKDIFATYSQFQNAVYGALEPEPEGGNPDAKGAFDWVWKPIGYRAKVFHPKPPLHEKIRDLVIDAFLKDIGADGGSVKDPSVTPTLGGGEPGSPTQEETKKNPPGAQDPTVK